MAGSGVLPSEPATSPEVFPWLKNLPLAPEYYPTLAEFQDPIAYIFKIEKEASKYGICKIVPPVLQSSKKTAISNINRSLLLHNSTSDPDRSPTFTTRQQQIGFCPRKPRPVQKSVWQSGERYTYQEFEAKAKLFEKTYLKKCSKKGVEKASSLSPLEIETLYWKATVDKPFSVEYANDMPGSAFSPKKGGNVGAVGEGVTVGDTEWNMRGVSRAKGSLLRFMKEEIPGVTSPMVYVAMMFSWFAWHVEDHDLHSLNYLHAGAGKTWYGVPREAAVAFEEVVRVHGYGGEINPLVTFAVLGGKTTIVSPEVIVGAGVPCCRLVQNPGEFVVTFPRAYHSGFSHGFNCGEAANIATPEWLRVAKDAAIRRASINYPPMVSHFQLLYDLAQELCTRLPISIGSKPRSSRLKDKQKGEGETLVKELFMKNLMQNNNLLHVLGKESSVVLLPRSSLDVSICSNLRVGYRLGVNPTLGLSSHNGMKFSRSLASNEVMLDRNHGIDQMNGYFPVKWNFASLSEKNRFALLNGNESICGEGATTLNGDKLPNQRLFSCVKCGILCFDCVAVLQPREAAARYLMSADCSFLNDWTNGSGVASDGFAIADGDANTWEQISSTRWVEKRIANDLYDVPVQSVEYQVQVASETGAEMGTSALGLLALTYGNLSDSEEDQVEADASSRADEIKMKNCSSEENHHSQDKQECHGGLTSSHTQSGPGTDNLAFDGTFEDPGPPSCITSKCSPTGQDIEQTRSCRASIPIESSGMSFQSFDEDSSRMHVFCLEHAVEVEQQLRPIGGAHVLLFCHPEYPRIDNEAKMVSEELGIDNSWNDIFFREASKEDEEKIHLALDCEEAIAGNADWAVKLGINLFYSANLSWSPLYSKQMPYNSIIYDAFGRSSPASSPMRLNKCGRRSGKQRKVVAGKWCGKVWMSNQVHPFLVEWDSEEKDPEKEQERSFRGWATPDEKFERKPHCVHKTETNLITKKYRRKRKLITEGRSVQKVKCLGTESVALYDSAEDNSYKQYSRTCNSKQAKFVEREVLWDFLEDNYHKQSGRIPESQRFISVEREDALSDDSLEDDTDQQHGRILRSKPSKYVQSENVFSLDAMERNSQKRYRRVSRSRQAKLVGREAMVSQDSLEDNDNFLDGRVRSKQAKFMQREDIFSDDSLDESAHHLHGRPHRSKQVKFVEDDVVSDDSLENRSYQQNRRISRVKKTRDIDSEDVSNDSLEEYSHLQHKIYAGRKLANFIQREGEFYDDFLRDDTSYQQRTQSSKHPKFVQMEDATSEDSIEEYTHQQQRRVPRSRREKFVETEDTISDDLRGYHTYRRRRLSKSTKPDFSKSEHIFSDQLQEDNVYQQPGKSPKVKKTKFFAEDVVSDDMPLTMHRKLRQAIRGTRAKYIRTEEAVSDDFLEDDSNRQCSRVVRSKPTKSTALRKVKRKTSQQMKKGTTKLTKETPQAIKAEREVKQENPRIRNNKSEQSLRQFDSHAEADLEGGPCTRLRKRPPTTPKLPETNRKENQKTMQKESRTPTDLKTPVGQKNGRIKDEDAEYQCDIEGCTMRFSSKQELALHKRNVCPVKGCGKKFFSHKYLVQHRRVHLDDRPLKCPWKGCKMTFKWAWARTEHIRVHTGARPYVCAEEGCGQTFRFVSDFSRHKRKTGHTTRKTGGNP